MGDIKAGPAPSTRASAKTVFLNMVTFWAPRWTWVSGVAIDPRAHGEGVKGWEAQLQGEAPGVRRGAWGAKERAVSPLSERRAWSDEAQGPGVDKEGEQDWSPLLLPGRVRATLQSHVMASYKVTHTPTVQPSSPGPRCGHTCTGEGLYYNVPIREFAQPPQCPSAGE